jgi:hypothetical protein
MTSFYTTLARFKALNLTNTMSTSKQYIPMHTRQKHEENGQEIRTNEVMA